MSKTPFELRYELLQLATNTLQSRYFAQLEEIKYLQKLIEDGKVKSDESLSLPAYPTIEEVFELADSYKKFIDQK
jgi:hypothetical protein